MRIASVGQGKESRCCHSALPARSRWEERPRVSRVRAPGGERRHRDGSRCVRSGRRGARGGGRAVARADTGVAALPQAAGTPGAAGIGDPYFPLLGNGGFDVRNYDASLAYDPATDRLDAHDGDQGARRCRRSRSFDLDLQQLDVGAVRVDNKRATFTRDGQELQITPRKRIREHSTFRVTVDYGGRAPDDRRLADRVRLAVRVPAHRGRRVRGDGAQRPVDVAAGVRPSERQGDVDVPRDACRRARPWSPTAGWCRRRPGAARRRSCGTSRCRWPRTSPPSTSATGRSRPASRPAACRRPWPSIRCCCRPAERRRLLL